METPGPGRGPPRGGGGRRGDDAPAQRDERRRHLERLPVRHPRRLGGPGGRDDRPARPHAVRGGVPGALPNRRAVSAGGTGVDAGALPAEAGDRAVAVARHHHLHEPAAERRVDVVPRAAPGCLHAGHGRRRHLVPRLASRGLLVFASPRDGVRDPRRGVRGNSGRTAASPPCATRAPSRRSPEAGSRSSAASSSIARRRNRSSRSGRGSRIPAVSPGREVVAGRRSRGSEASRARASTWKASASSTCRTSSCSIGPVQAQLTGKYRQSGEIPEEGEGDWVEDAAGEPAAS